MEIDPKRIERGELPFSKAAQLGHKDPDIEDRYKAMKIVYGIIYAYWLRSQPTGFPSIGLKLLPAMDAPKSYRGIDDLDLDHIEEKGSNPHLRFDLSNCQLITRQTHTLITDGKIPHKDYRPEEFKNLLKLLVF